MAADCLPGEALNPAQTQGIIMIALSSQTSQIMYFKVAHLKRVGYLDIILWTLLWSLFSIAMASSFFDEQVRASPLNDNHLREMHKPIFTSYGDSCITVSAKK